MDEDQGQAKEKVRVFAAASFLNDLGSDIIYPIWPLFVTEVLKANMAVVGFLDGLGEALVSLSQAASGYISDRIGRRKIFIWTGYLCGSLSRIGYALSRSWPHLIPFRILDRAGKIRSAPRDALVADVTTAANRGRTFGLLRTMDNLGAVCGILLSIALLPLLGYRLLFALAAVPSLAGALLVFSLIREDKGSERKIFKGLSLRDIGPNLRLYMFLSALFALGAFSYSFLLISARRSGFRTAFIPVLYLIFTATASLLSLPLGRLSDRIGRKRVLILAFLFWAAVCVGFLIVRRPAFMPLLFVLYGAHKAALDPVQKTLVCELSPLPFRASCLGGFQMVIGLCALPASLIAGWLWDHAGLIAPFSLSLGLTAIACLLLVFVEED
ncbi:MAG: major facilitator superfamily transporter [Candidatus Aminicenantes bacterium]|nr:major facilitator superfamily transporter [Candidatus Aminicenantes bacterium]